MGTSSVRQDNICTWKTGGRCGEGELLEGRLPLCLARGKHPIKEILNLHLSLLTCKMGNKT